MHQEIRILRLPQVLDKTGLSRSTVYAEIEEGNFPKPVQLTKRTTGWLEHEVNSWLATRIAAARGLAVERSIADLA